MAGYNYAEGDRVEGWAPSQPIFGKVEVAGDDGMVEENYLLPGELRHINPE